LEAVKNAALQRNQIARVTFTLLDS
jgi:hypothetical protein